MTTKAKIAINDLRRELTKQHAKKRAELKAIVRKPSATMEERMEAVFKLQKLPRNSTRTRVRNRCAMTGRSRGTYRKFGLSRIALRELGLAGQIPGLTKSSW